MTFVTRFRLPLLGLVCPLVCPLVLGLSCVPAMSSYSMCMVFLFLWCCVLVVLVVRVVLALEVLSIACSRLDMAATWVEVGGRHFKL